MAPTQENYQYSENYFVPTVRCLVELLSVELRPYLSRNIFMTPLGLYQVNILACDLILTFFLSNKDE